MQVLCNKSTILDCKLISLPKIVNPHGNLTFIEGSTHLPFDIKRIFYIYDVPTEESRGAHAHKQHQQFLICLKGSFDVALDDGQSRDIIHLNRPWKGLYIPAMIWAAEINFDSGAVCLVLSSDWYDEHDYYRNYSDFITAKNL